ncbi:hypothetical protein, partial [Xanthomonas oryzae]
MAARDLLGRVTATTVVSGGVAVPFRSDARFTVPLQGVTDVPGDHAANTGATPRHLRTCSRSPQQQCQRRKMDELQAG